jgi:sporulation protein YlmC with PRC-barrel domain
MMKRFRYVAILLSLALVLTACALAQKGLNQLAGSAGGSSSSGQNATQTGPASQTGQAVLVETLAPENGNPQPVEQGKPPQSQAAIIQPSEMRLTLTHLSNLMGYQVLDGEGNTLGVANDYIINTCEGYIIYMLMDPEASLKVAQGNRVVIPFEAVTINSGVLDAQKKTIQLHLKKNQFKNAPAFPPGQLLTPTDWEGGARGFWSKSVRIGKLATSCNVSGGPVYKVVFASQLLGLQLNDGNNNLLGTVQDVILEPESGNIGFYIVKPAKGGGLVMVRLAAINIPKEALMPGGTLSLVLLTEPKVFWDAPRISNVDEGDDLALQSKMRQYWGR